MTSAHQLPNSNYETVTSPEPANSVVEMWTEVQKCTITINASLWGSWHQDDESFQWFCDAMTHEVGHLFGHLDSGQTNPVVDHLSVPQFREPQLQLGPRVQERRPAVRLAGNSQRRNIPPALIAAMIRVSPAAGSRSNRGCVLHLLSAISPLTSNSLFPILTGPPKRPSHTPLPSYTQIHTIRPPTNSPYLHPPLLPTPPLPFPHSLPHPPPLPPPTPPSPLPLPLPPSPPAPPSLPSPSPPPPYPPPPLSPPPSPPPSPSLPSLLPPHPTHLSSPPMHRPGAGGQTIAHGIAQESSGPGLAM